MKVSYGSSEEYRYHHERGHHDGGYEHVLREATLRICGSLDIESVAEDCLEYLKDYIPLMGS